MKVEILGMGCSKCRALEEMVKEIVLEQNLDVKIVKVSDINRIIEYGVMITPGLVINGKVMVSGRLPSRDELSNYLKSAAEKCS